MASIEKRTRGGRVRWYARYRDPAGMVDPQPVED